MKGVTGRINCTRHSKMPHALTIAALLGIVFLSAYCGGGEMFVSAPARNVPYGARDPNEVHVPPVHTIRPVIHDAYGIPEHHFGDAPHDAAGSSGVSASEEQSSGPLAGAGVETVPDSSCAAGYQKSVASGACVLVNSAAATPPPDTTPPPDATPPPDTTPPPESGASGDTSIASMLENMAGMMAPVV